MKKCNVKCRFHDDRGQWNGHCVNLCWIGDFVWQHEGEGFYFCEKYFTTFNPICADSDSADDEDKITHYCKTGNSSIDLDEDEIDKCGKSPEEENISIEINENYFKDLIKTDLKSPLTGYSDIEGFLRGQTEHTDIILAQNLTVEELREIEKEREYQRKHSSPFYEIHIIPAYSLFNMKSKTRVHIQIYEYKEGEYENLKIELKGGHEKMRIAYQVMEMERDYILFKDESQKCNTLSITDGIEDFVKHILRHFAKLKDYQKRVFYIDIDDFVREILIFDGKFMGFKDKGKLYIESSERGKDEDG